MEAMTAEAVLRGYQDRIEQLQAALSQIQSQQAGTLVVLISALSAFAVLGFLTLSRRTVPAWSPSLPIPVAIVSARQYARRRSLWWKLFRLKGFYSHGVERLEERWAGHGITGEEFQADDHPYARDLDLFGRGSMFERLCTARTEIGRHRLARYLQEPAPAPEIRRRQEAVKELHDRAELRERIALLGPHEFNESRRETFAEWLNSPPAQFNGAFRWVTLVSSSMLAVLALAGVAGLVSWKTLALPLLGLLVFHGALGLVLRKRVRRVLERTRAVGLEIGLVREGLELLEKEKFRSEKLTGLVRRVLQETTAAAEVRRVERFLRILNERMKDWFYLPSLLLLCGSQCAMAIEAWRLRNLERLGDWLDAWAEFDALNSLASYAWERPEDCFPEIETHEPVYEAGGFGHPLLPRKTCVRNDIRLDSACRFYVVSGSNMTGKSTLLRALGLNAVLASAGAPTCARSLRLSAFSPCASIAVTDSLAEGKSKFLAEVDRLRTMLKSAVERPPVLFLIDEIFSGTNSHDRRIAAEAVVRTLVNAGAVGAISTHDLTLTGIAELDGTDGVNVHMGCRNKADPFAFDYLLKPGVTTEANALAIARLAGVPV
jgi:MutS domain V